MLSVLPEQYKNFQIFPQLTVDNKQLQTSKVKCCYRYTGTSKRKTQKIKPNQTKQKNPTSKQNKTVPKNNNPNKKTPTNPNNRPTTLSISAFQKAEIAK